MPYYTRLPRNKKFRCSECGLTNYGNYFLTSMLCKKCGAKRRRKVPNTLVSLSDHIVVTTAVKKKLRKKAESEIPRSLLDWLGSIVQNCLFLIFGVSGFFLARSLFELFSWPFWLFFIGWLLGGSYITNSAVDKTLSKPRADRKELIDTRILELADERRIRLEEQERFYSSPEWIALRNQVIKEEGIVCAICGRKITNKNDVAVDHKLPRSKYPKLQLSRDNLQVSCRQCNSSKGASEPLEI